MGPSPGLVLVTYWLTDEDNHELDSIHKVLADNLLAEEDRLAQQLIDKYLPDAPLENLHRHVTVQLGLNGDKTIIVNSKPVLRIWPWNAKAVGFTLEGGFHYQWLDR